MAETPEATWLTQEAYDRLASELEYLLTVARQDIAKKIQEAREEGDSVAAKPGRPPERRTQNPRNRAFGVKKPGQGAASQRRGKSDGGQPDPMKTSVGYIGADSFSRQRKEQGPGGRSGGPRRNGGRSR